MEKQPVQTACFENFGDAFLEFLRLRFEFEPLPHYVMAAVNFCERSGYVYFPRFVSDHLIWFARSFLFEQKGTFPTVTTNTDPADHQWRRYRDCQHLLEGWLEDDLKAALEEQEERLEIVKKVAEYRLAERDDSPGKAHRRRNKKTMTDAEVFGELAEYYGEKDYSLKRQHKKLTDHKLYMSGTFPLAIVGSGDGYTIKTLTIDRPGAISIPPNAKKFAKHIKDNPNWEEDLIKTQMLLDALNTKNAVKHTDVPEGFWD